MADLIIVINSLPCRPSHKPLATAGTRKPEHKPGFVNVG